MSVSFTCSGCGREVMTPPFVRAHRRFCTRGCATATYNREHLRGERNGRWRGGKALSYGPDWKKIKQQVREREGVCRACGKTAEQNGRALDVHHLNPYRFSGDNSLDNLVALCRSCHMRADDHGRKGSAKFVRGPVTPKRPTKREIRRLKQLIRAAEAKARRKTKQREAIALAEAGASLRQIARALDVSHQSVANWLDGRHIAREPAAPYDTRQRQPA